MMKTKQLLKFENNLSKLNDHYSHYLFVWEQFRLNSEDIFNEKPNKLITDLFSENINSKQFNVKISYLQESHEETQIFILNSLFVISYSYFEKYLIELHKFAKLLDDSILELNQTLNSDDQPNDDVDDNITIEKIFNRLHININQSLSEEEINTLNYLRLRRNRIIHNSLSTQGKILEIISHKGKEMNKYWDKNLRKGRYQIDFTKKGISSFEKLELFDLLNIKRKISSKIDKLVTDNLSIESLHQYIFNNFLELYSKKIRGLKEERIQKKFVGFCKSKYSYNISDIDLKEFDFKMV